MTAGRQEGDGAELEQLLGYLTSTRNFDFTAYTRAGLARRIGKRMRAVGADGHAAYARYLKAHPEEVERLLDAILINVTAFFRDDLPWEYLREEILPRLLAAKGEEPIRVWSAGCATGQEAYTLAIVLAEALGAEQFRERVKIYATDVDDDALARARQGSYDAREVEGLPPELLDRYFEPQDGRHVFRKDLRRLLIFGRNDLLQDAPISRIDLLACRNTLMYFDAAAQARVLARFHFALADGGYVMLGRAETLLTHHALFVPVDLRRRVFAKAPRGAAAGRPAASERPAAGDGPGDANAVALRDAGAAALRAAALDAGVVAQFVVDRAGRLASVNARARALLQLGVPDLGRPLQDLEVSYRPFELRSLIDQAHAEGRAVTRAEVPWRTPGGEQRWFDIVVAPLSAPPAALPGGGAEFAARAEAAGVSVTFVEVTRHKQLQQQIEEARAELETAYQELQSTNEELETTNEELHSTVEELETTNEELQSTNEELETMNEELQSTNEELQTINDELRLRSDELNGVNAFLESVFASLRAGVAVVDRELNVLVWNARAEDLWGLRAEEVTGRSFVGLDIGLPVARLVPALRASLAGDQEVGEVVVDAVNRRGRRIVCRVTSTPLVGRTDEGPRGAIVLMTEQPSPGGDGAAGDGAPAAARPDDALRSPDAG